ncbi:hypothetical protein DOTSEDRAFT_75439 [Dothistroma septosporum NZE10]|uniref:VOC domain-containing protein n=1 Tax=Dothistroma septosporum (strain NZE10 / CBS 128990) TaxID=675120 RepID=M2YIB9_DOTSN|nr:hypothetical protein DOTSEDRAFT_75439 [Dothistroma septosporum NZE10]
MRACALSQLSSSRIESAMSTPALVFPKVQNDTSKIQLERISHVYFEHNDLVATETFLQNFGLIEAWRGEHEVAYRGYGVDQICYVAKRTSGLPAYRGVAFVARSQADFGKAVNLSAGTVAEDLGYPGGGKRITLHTPSGFPFHVIYGQEDRNEPKAPSMGVQVENLGPFNGSIKKERLGEFQRLRPGPAMVHKLGHHGFVLQDPVADFQWYTSLFNFVPSDVQHVPSPAPGGGEMDVIAFLHLDLGEKFSDHHSLFVSRGQPGEADRMHHTSFEVESFDAQLLGHDWLAKKGYESVWGVGRHILGSQIFDYWRDPTGFTIEHYADGDVVNVHTATGHGRAGPLAVWGPEIPKDFEDGSLTVAHRVNSVPT